MSRLNLPARKTLVQELTDARRVDCSHDNAIAGLHKWVITKGDKEEQFSVVWIQGQVSQVSLEEDSFHIDDNSGVVMVTKASLVPPGCPKPKLGQYMMVIGELQKASREAVVRAMKYQDLSSDREQLSELWLWEVADSRRSLTLS